MSPMVPQGLVPATIYKDMYAHDNLFKANYSNISRIEREGGPISDINALQSKFSPRVQEESLQLGILQP